MYNNFYLFIDLNNYILLCNLYFMFLQGLTPLHVAARGGRVQVAKQLLNNEANKNATDQVNFSHISKE